MSLLIAVIFFGVFAIVLLLSMAFDSSGVQARKQTQERLDSISLAAQREPQDEALALMREEYFSSVPWIDQWLQRVDLFAGLRRLLSQADLNWTAQEVLLASLACWVVGGA